MLSAWPGRNGKIYVVGLITWNRVGIQLAYVWNYLPAPLSKIQQTYDVELVQADREPIRKNYVKESIPKSQKNENFLRGHCH